MSDSRSQDDGLTVKEVKAVLIVLTLMLATLVFFGIGVFADIEWCRLLGGGTGVVGFTYLHLFAKPAFEVRS